MVIMFELGEKCKRWKGALKSVDTGNTLPFSDLAALVVHSGNDGIAAVGIKR